MQIIDPNDPPPVPCLDLPIPAGACAPMAGPRARLDAPRAPPLAREQRPLDVLDEALRSALQDEPAKAQRVRAPHGDLPDLATRIDEAQRQARSRRVQQGLPADADDGAYTLKRPRKHAPKRSKKHGQFLGTVCDSWEDKTRTR